MFGYILPNADGLTQAQQDRYRACYCGLCRSIGERFSQPVRLTLTYDMTFLILLLGSLYEPEEQSGEARCLPHPTRKHPHVTSDVTAYAADMNVALAYCNLLDDWKDDKNPISGLGAKALASAWADVETRWPRQCAAIRRCLDKLDRIEREDLQHPDAPARAFGELMAELMVWKQDRWEPHLRALGDGLGQFVYILDAFLDLESDRRKGRYNPFRAMAEQNALPDMKETLMMFIGECTMAFEGLPLVQDTDILRNILYAGVWTRYAAWEKKGEKST